MSPVALGDRYQRRVCANPIRHTPAPMVLEKHHVRPLSWGGEDVPTNVVMICSTCHMGAHTALNARVAYDRAGTDMPDEVWQRFHPYYRALASQAIAMAGGIIRVYTTPLAPQMGLRSSDIRQEG